jgi:hypothetical protein
LIIEATGSFKRDLVEYIRFGKNIAKGLPGLLAYSISHKSFGSQGLGNDEKRLFLKPNYIQEEKIKKISRIDHVNA